MSVVKLLELIRNESSEADKSNHRIAIISAINESPSLDFTNQKLTRKDFQILCSVLNSTKLQSLSLDGVSFNSIQVSAGNSVEYDKDIALLAQALKSNTSITKLSLQDTDLTDSGLARLAEALKTNRSVTSLNLCSNEIMDAKSLLKALETNNVITDIDLRGNDDIAKLTLKDINTKLVSNRALLVQNPPVEEPPAKEPVESPVEAPPPPVKDPEQSTVLPVEVPPSPPIPVTPQPKAKPEDFKLALTPVSDPTLAQLGNFNRVADILKYMKGEERNNEKIALLKEELKGVKNLVLAKEALDDEDLIHLTEALSGSEINLLDLSENNISDIGMIALAKVLKNTQVQYLFLSYNKIGEQGSIVLAKELNSAQITSLDLTQNEVGPKGAIAFAKALKNNNKLQNLYLMKSNIDFEGAKQIIKALEKHKALEFLHMGGNNLGESPHSLVDFIGKNQSLKQVYVSMENPINLKTLPVPKTLPVTKKTILSTLANSPIVAKLKKPFFIISGFVTAGAFTATAIVLIGLAWPVAVLVGLGVAILAASSLETVISKQEALQKLALPPIPVSELSEVRVRYTVLDYLRVMKTEESSPAFKEMAEKKLNHLLKVATGLNLRDANLDDVDMENLSKAMPKNSPLINLNLAVNNITSKGLKVLSRALAEKATSLETLNLAKNKIMQDGGESLAQMLKKVKLKVLILNHNNIGKGIQNITDVLQETSRVRLEVFSLKANNVDGTDGKSIASMISLLARNTTLKVLDLEDYPFSTTHLEDGLIALDMASAISNNPDTKIEKLVLGGKGIRDENKGINYKNIVPLINKLKNNRIKLLVNQYDITLPLPSPENPDLTPPPVFAPVAEELGVAIEEAPQELYEDYGQPENTPPTEDGVPPRPPSPRSAPK